MRIRLVSLDNQEGRQHPAHLAAQDGALIFVGHGRSRGLVIAFEPKDSENFNVSAPGQHECVAQPVFSRFLGWHNGLVRGDAIGHQHAAELTGVVPIHQQFSTSTFRCACSPGLQSALTGGEAVDRHHVVDDARRDARKSLDRDGGRFLGTCRRAKPDPYIRRGSALLHDLESTLAKKEHGFSCRQAFGHPLTDLIEKHHPFFLRNTEP